MLFGHRHEASGSTQHSTRRIAFAFRLSWPMLHSGLGHKGNDMHKLTFILAAAVLLGTATFSDRDAVADSHGEPQLTADVAREAIVGSWQDAEDSAAVVTYNADGSYADEYEGEEPEAGTWEVFSDESLVRLRVVIDGNDYDYEILSVTDEHMSISYMARGNTLRYVRVTE